MLGILIPQNASQNCCSSFLDHFVFINGRVNHFDLHEKIFVIIRTREFADRLEFNMLRLRKST